MAQIDGKIGNGSEKVIPALNKFGCKQLSEITAYGEQ